MYRAARALVIKPSKDQKLPATAYDSPLEQIINYGVITETVYAGSDVDLSVIDVLPDVVILDVGSALDPSVMSDYSKRLLSNKLSKVLPIVVVGSPNDFSLFDVNLHLNHRAPAHVIAKKLKHLIRVNAMKIEYARRIETARLFNVAAPAIESLQSPSSERLLVVGKGERYFQLASIFNGSATLKSAANFEEARTLFETHSFDCLIIDTLAYTNFDIDTLKQFKLDARYFTLPVLLLQEGLDTSEQEALVETGICDLFDLDGEANEIVTYTKTLIQAEKLRSALLMAFKSRGFDKIRDKSTNLPSNEFFERHLDKLVRQSQAWKTPIAFGMLDVSVLFNTETASDKQRQDGIFGQVGQTIASLVRAEDIATYRGDGKFIVAAPNSSGLTISVLIGRISAVLSMTEFSVGGLMGKVDVDTHYFDSKPEDSLAQIMESLTTAYA
ncbi:MAG: diguanylate cyclase [Hyphomicrobiales bacterium]